MRIKVTYKGLGKLEDWYAHEDYYKLRIFKNIYSFMMSDNTITIKSIKGEEFKESLDNIETVEIIKEEVKEICPTKDRGEIV